VAVGNAYDRFYEDALRMLRAVRFSVTKRFVISPEIEAALCNEVLLKRLRENIAEDRVKDEITKMFQHDIIRAAHMLFEMNPALARTIFTDDRRLWLKPTLEKA
jgi:tRNA nucleotidyltransferase/poly(A) polymerase